MITNSAHKALMLQSIEDRNKLVQSLAQHPHNSETAMLIIGKNELIRTLWHYLDHEDMYSDEFYIYKTV